MKLAIISLESESSKMIAEEAKNYFSQVDLLNIKEIEINVNKDGAEVLYKNEPIEKYDCVYCRGSYKYAVLLRSITHTLNKEAYMPLASESFTIGHDKFLTLIKLQKNNIPVPKTYLTATTKQAKKIIKNIHYPAILKTPSGTHGKGVMFADSPESAKSMIDALEVFKQPYIIEEYIETNATDIRAFVVGDEVVASMKRKAIKGELRANLHAGGEAQYIILDYDTKQLAIKSAKALNASICGVDILQGVKPLILEVNISPGLQGITKISKKNIAEHIAKFLIQETKKFKQLKKSSDYNNVLKEYNIHDKKEIITNLNIKAGVIRLPSSFTQITKFKDEEDVEITVKEKFLKIKKHDIK
ncbi:MAG: RimK family alpha-L-glutamate ligase [Nanoarchaeota archaeon]|nr:RimK family alpha-L-glutamate ligase [Nanoarchaeota archaeon]